MYTIIVNTPGPQGQPGPQGPSGSQGPSVDTGSFVVTSSFNDFTSSYYIDSASFNSRIDNINFDTSSLATTGSNTFIGDQIINGENLGFIVDAGNLKRVGFMKYGGIEGSIARVANQNFRILRTTGSDINDGTNAITDFYIAGDGKIGIGTTSPAYTLDVSGSSNFTNGQTIVGNVTFPSSSFISTTNESGSLFLSALNNGTLFLNNDGGEGDVVIGHNGWNNKLIIKGNQIITGSVDITGSLTVNTVNVGANTINFVDENKDVLTSLSYSGSNLVLSNGSFILSTGSLAGTASYAQTASFAQNAQTASFVQSTISSSFALTSSYVNALNQDVLITGSLTVLQGATIYGSSSFLYVTASQLAVSASYISVNVFEPFQRFGGLIVYDSGSSQTTSSLTWDSLNNHWVYQNASGSTYTGGMLLSGPRNTGSLGDEPTLTQYFIPRSDGGDHLNNSQIYSSGSTTQITGSLTVTQGITGSFSGSGADLYNIPSSAITGLNLSQISSGSYSASISNNQLLVNTSVTATSFIGNGSQLTGIFLEKRHDFTGSYSYCGTAPSGSAESANVWDINRITIYPAGNTLIQSASLVSWTNRYNNIYN